MRKIVLGAMLAVYLAGSAALGAEIKATITHIDANARIIVIDGRAFHIGRNLDITVLIVGDVVTVVFEEVDGQVRIVSIKVD